MKEACKIYPDEGQTDYAYDALNRLASTTWTREVSAGTRLKATRAYAEKTGELVSVSYNDGTTPSETHTYNHLGQLTQTVDAAGTRVYVYNNYNEIESETLTGDAIAHAVTELRDTFGRGTGYTYAKNGSVQQTTGTSYDAASGRIVTASFVHGGATKTFTYNYLAGTNLLESLACPSNLTIVQSHENKRDLITGMTIRRETSTNVVLRNYTYDALGRPLTRSTSRNDTTQNDAFGYNTRSELISATLGSDNYSYSFDNIGNRSSATETTTALAYETNNLNQYSGVTSSESSASFAFNPVYDADGNATLIRTSTGTWSVEYNGANRPIRFENTETQTVVECGYDSQGRRYFKKVTIAGTVTLHHRYIYRGYLQIAAVDLTRSNHPALWLVTWDPSQPTATRPLAIQKDGTWFTYGYDITKNICEVFGPAGYIRTSYSYAPFGSVSASGDVTQPFQWSSEHYDEELGLVYYNYRHYSPGWGRWLSRDPIEEQGGRNLYAFVKNNGIQMFDLLGEDFCDWVYCLAKCIEDNDLIDNFYAALASKITLMIIGGGVPKRFAVWLAEQSGNHRMAIAIGKMNPKIPSSMFAWKPMKAALAKFKNGRILASKIYTTSTPLLIVYGNVMAVIEVECAIYCCKNRHYNKKDGLRVFNVPVALDFYLNSLTWRDLGYDETDLLP